MSKNYVMSVAAKEDVFQRIVQGERKFCVFTGCTKKDFNLLKVGSVVRIYNTSRDKSVYVRINDTYRGDGVSDGGIVCTFDKVWRQFRLEDEEVDE